MSAQAWPAVKMESNDDNGERYIRRCVVHRVELRVIAPTTAWPTGFECPQGHKIVDRWELFDTETRASVYVSARHGLLGANGEPVR